MNAFNNLLSKPPDCYPGQNVYKHANFKCLSSSLMAAPEYNFHSPPGESYTCFVVIEVARTAVT